MREMRTSSLVLAVVAATILAPSTALRAEDATAQVIQQQLDVLYSTGSLSVAGVPVLSGQLLGRFYEQRAYAPVWTEQSRIDELLALLASAAADGLDPDDYALDTLRELVAREQVAGSEYSGELDLLLTESLVRYGYHQRFGKVDPATVEPTWNFRRSLSRGEDPPATLQAALDASSLRGFFSEWLKRGPLYLGLQAALTAHREIAARGGWGPVPDGPTLRVGDRDPRVAALRARLVVTGDPPDAQGPDAAGDPALFDATLAAGVRNFQSRHGLEVDGIVGRQTLAAMNVTVEQRIDQLRLSLERARWVMEERGPEFVVVNIAGAQVYVVQDGKVTWTRRAVVGRPYRQTPVFKGRISYLELNPTWTVPPTILRKDILPKVREDPGYLAAQNITVLDATGRVVDPWSVDWNALRGMPYTLRQEPGPNNALGRIKFMFPNEHFVFLHDTPSRALFARAERTFSSGCIRVADPTSLAEILLRDPAQWSEQQVEAAIATGRTRRVTLRDPWPILVLYWTAEQDEFGRSRFYSDVYNRDARLLRALNGPVNIRPPEPV